MGRHHAARGIARVPLSSQYRFTADKTVQLSVHKRRWNWLLLGLVALLILTGAVLAVRTLLVGDDAACVGKPVTATVVAAPEHADVMKKLATGWQRTAPEVDGTCAAVKVVAKDSHEVAAALSKSWDTSADGPRPDAWAPESLAWANLAATRSEAKAMLDDKPQSLAHSPVVMAIPTEQAKVLGWPEKPLGWSALIAAFADDPTWGGKGKPEWGRMGIGMADPTRSTEGLLTLLSVTDPNGDGEIGAEEQPLALRFERSVVQYTEDAGRLFSRVALGGNPKNGETLATAFPAMERDVARYQAGKHKTALSAVYPAEGVADADFPFIKIKASWVSADKRAVTEKFLDYATSSNGQKAYGAAGFRAPDGSTKYAPQVRAIASEKTAASYRPRKPAVSGPLTESLVRWKSLRRPANVVALLDTSGSMGDQVQDRGATKLQILQQAGRQAITLFNDRSRLGVWEFSFGLNGNDDWREVAPLRGMTEDDNGTSHRAACISALESLQPKKATGLHDSVNAAYEYMKNNYQPDQQNLLVVLTDGHDEDPAGMSRDDLINRLKNAYDPNRPVQILAFAYGPDGDVGVLQDAASATHGRAYSSWDPADIGKAFLTAMYER